MAGPNGELHSVTVTSQCTAHGLELTKSGEVSYRAVCNYGMSLHTQGYTGRQTQTDRQTDRQADRHASMQADKQTDGQTEGLTYKSGGL